MSADIVTEALSLLTAAQKSAVDWDDGAMLVLAGPGSGKTRVLTSRIARILNSTPDKSFRLMALTFTNKAADEMNERILALVPGMERRLFVGTFHSFCVQLLQQHGSHIDLSPDFTIFSQEDDRREVLIDALKPIMRSTSDAKALARYLSMIDKAKGRLLGPEGIAFKFKNQVEGKQFEEIYHAYEAELRRLNGLDFNSLIHRSYDLLTAMPAVAVQYRSVYRYWLVDEFQDTNKAQYSLLKVLAGDLFKNVFAVADDDQIIYHWNGASYQQIQRFRADFQPAEIQLPTNYRCPPRIVACANRLVVNNKDRTENKLPLEVGKTNLMLSPEEHLRTLQFTDDDQEATGIAKDLAERGCAVWSSVAVLARTRALLEKVNQACRVAGVPAVIAQRRDEFASQEYQWLHAVLRQASHPLDRRCFAVVVSTFNRLFGCDFQSDFLIAQAEGTQQTFLQQWEDAVQTRLDNECAKVLAGIAVSISKSPTSFRQAIDKIRQLFDKEHESVPFDGKGAVDFDEDRDAWSDLSRLIFQYTGSTATLDQFLQDLAMRSKEPPVSPNTVLLMTVHGAKGKEYDYVYVMGLAEDVLPSFQSLKAGDDSAEMEEERRNCFVAITRTRESLTLSWAARYRGWPKNPSRFLVEMGIVR